MFIAYLDSDTTLEFNTAINTYWPILESLQFIQIDNAYDNVVYLKIDCKSKLIIYNYILQ